MAGKPSALFEGYVLHLRPYRETGALCELFTLERGRLSAVAHSVRGRRGGSAPQAFVRYSLPLGGRGELKSLGAAEALDSRWLEGTALAAGLYLNELLVRLLPREDAHERLFSVYGATLDALAASALVEPVGPGKTSIGLEVALRAFERVLLEELGYGVPFSIDHEGRQIEANLLYRLEPAMGFVSDRAGGVDGATLLAIDAGEYSDPAVRRAARRLFNAMLVPHLEGRAIQARMLLARGGQPRSVTAGQDVEAQTFAGGRSGERGIPDIASDPNQSEGAESPPRP